MKKTEKWRASFH